MSNGWYQLERERGRRGGAVQQDCRRSAPPMPIPKPVPRPAPVPPAQSRTERGSLPKEECAPAADCVRAEQEVCPPPLPEPRPEPACGEPCTPAAPVPAARTEPEGPAPRKIEWAPAQGAGPDPYGDQLGILHSQTVGPDGPVVLQDMALHETLIGFVHEKLVERAVHVKGWGAMGRFICEHDMSAYTMLPFLQRPGCTVPTASRFSLAVSNKGTPDTSRNVRGFSTKFYTEQGVFDLLCNHLPVFSVRDAIRFPESIKAFLPAPTNNLIDPQRFWDFVARAPESTNFVTWLYSDMGTVKSLRRLRAYGVNTYVWKNKCGERRYVKYHWIPKLGAEYITAGEAEQLACQNPDCAGQDLYDAIRRGDCPCYELNVQLMEPWDAEKLPYDPLDDTKVWSESDYPLIPVGTLTLDRNPDCYREQVEKLAFSPSNLLEGAELSADKMLQGRSFIYTDAQRYRLGQDFRRSKVNGQADWRADCQAPSGIGVEACGVQERTDICRQDDFTQAGEFFRSLCPEEREHLTENLAGSLAAACGEVRRTVLGYLWQADEEYGRAVAEKLR